MNRLNRVIGQLEGAQVGGAGRGRVVERKTLHTLHGDKLKWDGWGYADTRFVLNKQGQVELRGPHHRYLFSGRPFPSLRPWLEENAGLNIKFHTPSQTDPPVDPPIRNDGFMDDVKGHYKRVSFDPKDRLFHSHGHTCQEMYQLKFGKMQRVVDVVMFPTCEKDVQVIVKAAHDHNVCIIPYGGGTSVSQALVCPTNEKRMIVSLDMHLMNKVRDVNRQSMTCVIEAGAVGQDIDKELAKYNLVMGHEPDSSEFSTMGGWVATRASGMKKNKYGNIEDIVQRIRVVTPTGIVEKNVTVPRISTGPDINEFILGSEGTLGVITEAVVRLRPKAECRRYGSLIFPNFEQGVACLHEVAIRRAAPVSIRLVDNLQFQFGQTLKPPQESWSKGVIDSIKKWYVLNHKKFDPNKMVAATLLFEGSSSEVSAQEKVLYAIANKYGGMKAGAENGIRGYFLTYMIAYLRDFGFNYSFMAESFETSITWDKVLPLCSKVKEVIYNTAAKHGVKHRPFVSCRVTQTYDTGACVYFYFGFVWAGLKDPIGVFSEVEHSARDKILQMGGSLSHHHGVGKLRAGWMPQTVGETGMRMLRAVKNEMDPKNVFGNGNLGLKEA